MPDHDHNVEQFTCLVRNRMMVLLHSLEQLEALNHSGLLHESQRVLSQVAAASALLGDIVIQANAMDREALTQIRRLNGAPGARVERGENDMPILDLKGTGDGVD